MSIDLSALNDNQRRAVAWNEGPLLVLAGPGSGKTRVLTYRIARLIEASPEQRYKILGLTFTNKAAAEMRERIEELVPDCSARTLLTTFHSFCADLLRQHGHHLGLRPDFTIMAQQGDCEALLEDAIEEVHATDDYKAERLLPLVARLLDLNVGVDEAQERLQRGGVDDSERLARIYAQYRRQLIQNNRLDFGALIAEALRLIETHAGVRKQIHRVYPHVCVDEFQDTNLSQYCVLRQLVNPATRNLFVVADDDQIIYQWNGASPERLNELREEFQMTVIQLPENYRCPPGVIEVANRLIVNNLGRSADKEILVAHKTAGKDVPIRIKHFPSLNEEARWVAHDIMKRPSTDRTKCAILSRTRKVLDPFIVALADAGISGFLSVRKNEFLTPPLEWMHAMLRLANARQDREQLRRACKAFYTLEGINLDVRDLVSAASAEDGDFLRAWQRAVLRREEIEPHTRTFVQDSVTGLCDRLEFWGFVKAAFEWFSILRAKAASAQERDEEYEQEKAVWHELVNEVVMQYGHDAITLHVLLQELDLRSKTPTPPAGAIPCFTIHASKGMEFGHVYLVALVEDQLPSWAAIKKGDDSHEMQEERRSCFVALTRAQESLTLSFSDEVFGWSKEPSRFLREMGLVRN